MVLERYACHLISEVTMDRNNPSSILIVGEDTHFCYLMQSFVRKSACQMMFSNPGDGVLEIAQREHPDAIVLDMDMPAMRGWILLRELKANQATHDIPVVICTWRDDQERGTQDGASVYLRMPILYADFLKALSRIGVKVNSQNV